MATPKKVDSISLSDTTLNDSELIMTLIDGAALANWLGNVTSSDVAVFLQEDASAIHLVFAALDSNGHPSATDQFSSPLPCPPYCPR